MEANKRVPIQNQGDAVPAARSWRDVLPIHPAAELFPAMSDAELKELAEDIKAHGLRTPIVIWTSSNPDEKDEHLIDGISRLDAMEMAGLLDVNHEGLLCIKRWDSKSGTWLEACVHVPKLYCYDDPLEAALSFNIHRRHLTAEQKRELIAKVLKAKPDFSDRQISSITRTDHKTAGAVRAEMEGRGEIPHVEVRTDRNCRKQPSAKPTRKAGRSFRQKLTCEVSARTDIKNPEQLPNKVLMDAIAVRNLETTPDLVDQCVENVREIVERTITEMRRVETRREGFARLFAALGDTITDLEQKALTEDVARAAASDGCES